MIRKSASEKVNPILEIESVKQPVTLDDQSIRELLRLAYCDFQENIPESEMPAAHSEALLVPFFYSNQNEYSSPVRVLNSPNISLFWNLLIQRHIISFEEESLVFLNYHGNQPW